jgi:HD-like signal output (HDOD) protein
VSSANNILKKFKTIKTIPHIAIRLTQMISDSGTTVREIEEVISLDPTLVLRVLKLINSAYYGLRRKVDSIADAIVYLGLDVLRNMIVLEAVKALIDKDVDGKQFSRQRLWLHCAVVGISNQMVSERIFKYKGDNAFLMGILHDIGIIVEDQVVPGMFEEYLTDEKYRDMALVDFERQFIDTDHSEIGYLLCKEWKLPHEICESIRDHHRQPSSFSNDKPSIVVQISEYLATKLEYWALKDQEAVLAPPLRQHLMDNITEYKVILMDLPEEISRARSIYQMDGEPS